MKLTGKLMTEGITPFIDKKNYLHGHLISRIWILVGDNHFVRIYNKVNGDIELIGEAESDNQINNTHFANDITNFLEQVETFDVFDKLIIVAAPPMLDELNSSFSKLVENKIIAEIHKDLNNFKDDDLKEELNKIIWF